MCSLSVVIILDIIVNISHFHLLQNHRASFNQTWHKASLVKREFKFILWKGHDSFFGEIIRKKWKYIFISYNFSSTELCIRTLVYKGDTWKVMILNKYYWKIWCEEIEKCQGLKASKMSGWQSFFVWLKTSFFFLVVFLYYACVDILQTTSYWRVCWPQAS